MADKGYVNTLINALPENVRYPVRNAFWYLMDNWRLGTGSRAINAQLYRVTGTTAAVAGTEFTIKHGMNTIPVQLFPVLDLRNANDQLVPLQVSKAPDNVRVYLKSTSTNVNFTVFLE